MKVRIVYQPGWTGFYGHHTTINIHEMAYSWNGYSDDGIEVNIPECKLHFQDGTPVPLKYSVNGIPFKADFLDSGKLCAIVVDNSEPVSYADIKRAFNLAEPVGLVHCDNGTSYSVFSVSYHNFPVVVKATNGKGCQINMLSYDEEIDMFLEDNDIGDYSNDLEELLLKVLNHES